MAGERVVGQRAGRALPLPLAVVIAACSSSSAPPAATTSLTVGVESEQLGGEVGAAHLTTTVDGNAATDETLQVLNNPGAFPHAIRLTPPSSNPSARVDVEIEGYVNPAYMPGNPNDKAILTRLASTSFVPGMDMLLRINLQQQCLLPLPGGPPGAPICTAPQTCISGLCRDDSVATSSLEPYSDNWPTDAPDVCKPAGAGPPVVYVGTGQSDYLPLTDGQMLQAELGPQGGHHIWIAARMHNLKQSGSTTTITAVIPSTGFQAPPTGYIFTFNPDEGGFCKLYGLRFQLDAGGVDYHPFLGNPLDVTVTIKDSSGTVGTGLAHITVAPTILCPPSTPNCK